MIRDQICHAGEHFTVIYNKKVLTDGHSLIITKRHAQGLLDLTAAEVRELFDMINQALPAILDVYNNGERAYDIKIRSGEYSGRTVDHFHVHLIPRKRIPDGNGGTERERIYEKNLQNPDRPVLEDFKNELTRIRRGMDGSGPAVAFAASGPGAAHVGLDKVFYESRHFVALYHPAPIIEGKALLVPKRDISDFLELTRVEQRDFARTYAKVMNMLLDVYGDDSRSYITSMQTGGYNNMPLERLHVHLIPRSKSDRYVGRDDDIYYDMYEGKGGTPIMTESEIRKEVESLRRLAQE